MKEKCNGGGGDGGDGGDALIYYTQLLISVKSHDNLSLTFHGPKWWSNNSNTLWVTLLRLWVMPTLVIKTPVWNVEIQHSMHKVREEL
jgi:hypothetical protein